LIKKSASLFPQEPTKEEDYPSINPLVTLGEDSSNRCDPICHIAFLKRGDSIMYLELLGNLIPHCFRKITLCYQVINVLRLTITEGTGGVARTILLHEVISCRCFSKDSKPSEVNVAMGNRPVATVSP
jgi:hypothetical protein